jgi:hypothetical protein
MSLNTQYTQDQAFLNNLADKYQLDFNIDKAISKSETELELISNLCYQAVTEINDQFIAEINSKEFEFMLKPTNNDYWDTRLEEMQEKLSDLVFINASDSRNQLAYFCENFFTKDELAEIEKSGIDINFYDL